MLITDSDVNQSIQAVKLASAEFLSNKWEILQKKKKKKKKKKNNNNNNNNKIRKEETKYKARLTPAIFPLPKKMRGESP